MDHYDNIDGLSGTIYVVILGPAGPLMHLDQISLYRPVEPFATGIKMKSRGQHIILYYIKRSRNVLKR